MAEFDEIQLSRGEAGAALARLYGPSDGGITVVWRWDQKLGDLADVVLVPSPKIEGAPQSEDVIRSAQDRVGATGCLMPRSSEFKGPRDLTVEVAEPEQPTDTEIRAARLLGAARVGMVTR